MKKTIKITESQLKDIITKKINESHLGNRGFVKENQMKRFVVPEFSNLYAMINEFGYEDMDNFVNDHPGLVDVMIEWVQNHKELIKE